MPVDRRDELGPIPEDIAAHLTPCFERGPRPAVRANVAIASGVLLVVPDASETSKFTGIPAILTATRAAKLPYLVADPLSNVDDACRWVRGLSPSSGSRRVLVTGPRGTRWQSGESVARRLVSALVLDP